MGTPISSLPLASTPTGTEFVPIVQSGTTKRATTLEIAQTLLPITTSEISDANITVDKLASDSVTTVKIVDANVTAAKLASGAAVSNIGTGGITATQLASNSVTTAKIADASITAAKLDGAQTGAAPVYGVRAWVNFDGTKDTTGATSAANTNRLIRASSSNVSSVLRNSAGNYTVTFSGIADANFCAQILASRTVGGETTSNYIVAVSSTTLQLAHTEGSSASGQDVAQCHVTILR